MKHRTVWLVTGALGVVGATGFAVTRAGELADRDLGDAVVVETGTLVATSSAEPSSDGGSTEADGGSTDADDGSTDPGEGPSSAPELATISVVSPPSAVSANSGG